MGRQKAPRAPLVEGTLGGLGDLLRAAGMTASPSVEEEPAAGPSPDDTGPIPTRLVVRRERKGHGGRTVVRVEGFTEGCAQLDPWAKALRVAMGAGARVDGPTLVVQGDLADRVDAWLRAQGVATVVRGN